jgi:hypothetical protein
VHTFCVTCEYPEAVSPYLRATVTTISVCEETVTRVLYTLSESRVTQLQSQLLFQLCCDIGLMRMLHATATGNEQLSQAVRLFVWS